MYLSKYQFDSLRQFLQKKPFVLACRLYGSYARGTAIAKSDIDLLLTIDYHQLEGKIEEYITLGSELTTLIGQHVSILTWEALSHHIKPFTNNDLVLVYDREKNSIPYPEQFFSIFDKFSFRDKARLEHIRDALKLIQVWVNGESEDGSINAPQLISACQKQLQVSSALAKQLSSTTQHELESAHPGQSPLKKLRLIGSQAQPYFGVDNKIIWQIVNSLVPGISMQVETFLNGWDDYYKGRLIQHFINFFESQINPSRRTPVLQAGEWTRYKDQIAVVVSDRNIHELTPEVVEEGERNLANVASALNLKNVWNVVVDFVCPLWPLCK